MKKITSQALKTLLALLLAILMVAGSTVSSFAVVRDDLGDTGKDSDLASTGYSGWAIYGNTNNWASDLWSGSGSSGTAYIDASSLIGSNFEFKLVCEGTWCGTSGTTAVSKGTQVTLNWGSGNNVKYKVTKGVLKITVSDTKVTVSDDYARYKVYYNTSKTSTGGTGVELIPQSGSTDTRVGTKSLSANTRYYFYVKDEKETKYMRNASGTMNNSQNEIQLYEYGTNNTDSIDMTTNIAGTYTFTYDASSKKIKTKYPDYSMTVSNDGHGTPSVSPSTTTNYNGSATYSAGTPSAGYEFDYWELTSGSVSPSITDANKSSSSLTLAPTGNTSPVNLQAHYKLKTYAITLSETGASGGTMQVDSAAFSSGSTVTHGSHSFRIDPPDGYVISSISGIGTWSNNSTYATLSSSSITEAKTISVTYASAGTCAITAKKTNSSGATLTTEAMTIGSNLTVYAEGNAYHSSGNFSVTSSNSSVASVSSASVAKNGTFTVAAKTTGSATITISCPADSKSTTFTVNVSNSDLAISCDSSILKGDKRTATYTSTNSVSSVSWSSADTSKFTVNSSGVVSGVAAGTANLQLTATFANGGTQTVTKSITIVEPTLSLASLNMSLNYCADTTNAGSDYKGIGTDKVTHNAATYSGTVTAASSNTSVATVSYDGTSGTNATITAKGVGTATITFTYKASDGSTTLKTTTLTVTVSAYDVNMTLYVATSDWTSANFIPHTSTGTTTQVTGGTAMIKIGTKSGSGAVFALNITKKQYTNGFVIGQAAATRTSSKRNTPRIAGSDPSKNLVTITNGSDYWYGGTTAQTSVTITKPVISAKTNETLNAGATKTATAPTISNGVTPSSYKWTSSNTSAATISGTTSTPTITGVVAGSASASTVRAFIPLANTGITFSALETSSTEAYDYIASNAQSFNITVNDVKHTITVVAVSRDTSSGTYTTNAAAMSSSSVSPTGGISHGGSATVSATAAAGYVLTGYYSAATGSATQYTNGAISSVTSDMTVYARFEQKYTLTVAKGGETSHATVSPTSVATYAGTKPGNITVTVDTGYLIDWDNSTNLSKYYNAPSSLGGTVTLTAKEAANINSSDKVNTNVTIAIKVLQYTVSGSAQYSDSSTNGAFTPGTTGGSLSISQTGTVNYGTNITLTATAAEGYSVVGIYRVKSESNWEKVECAETTSGGRTSVATNTGYTINDTTNDTYTFVARFAKIYYLTFYDTYVNTGTTENPVWTYTASPPRTVTVTRNSATVATYTYSAGTLEQRGEDNQYANGGTKSEDHILSETGTYYEGNKLQVLAGDTVTATYSALASSDVISGIFFNNGIRYTTDLEPDNLYTSREYQPYSGNGEDDGDGEDDDWQYTYRADTTLYADARYYPAATADIIGGQTYQVSANNIVQNTHAVTWTAKSDYLNIDLELASKKQIVFSDTKNTVINSLYTDNYYSIGDDISTGSTAATRLAVYAKGNANQTNTITLANVKLYYYDSAKASFTDASGNTVSTPVELTGGDAVITKNISAGSSIANSDSTDSTAYIYFTGTMPATDVYVDLDVAVTYKMYIGSKMMSDTIGNHDRFADVATVTATPSTTGQSAKTAPNNAAYNSTANTIKAGDTVTYTYSFIGSNGSWYMFNGWYKGDSSGPDLDNGLLSTKQTFTYKPTASTYVYAVGTRDLFINGSKYITGASADWNKTNDVPQNFKMSFDPSLGNKGRYYWEITDTIFSSANKSYTVGTYDYYTWDNWTDQYHWRDNNSIGNSFFQFFDESTGWNRSVWDQLGSFQTIESGKIQYGKVLQHDDNNFTTGSGYIYFNETTHNGYSSPIRIYYDPDTKATTVEPTYVYNHIYVSNGFNGIDTTTTSNVTIKVNNGTARANNTTNDNSFTQYMKFNGSGWTPSDNNSTANIEGHISDITIGAKDATVTISKTVASSSYKVSSFVVYDLYNDSVKSYTPTASSNTYSVNLQMVTGHNLYIVPIIESASANMKVVVDATQLNKEQWGDLVGCYAWYSSGNAYGGYPGQLMIPSDDGQSFSANFPATNGSGGSLVGITFSNYLDGTKTWLGCTNVLGAVTTQGSDGSGNIIPTYNKITQTDSNYNRTNYKAQTYDYREPVAFYANKDAGASSFLMNFALKQGNANLISWAHADMTGNNILTFKTAHSTWDDVNFEYLTTADGSTYADMNGVALTNKPTASFYVAAKGMVTYSSSTLNKVFSAGKTSTTVTGITYPNEGSATGANVTANNAVQWYVYDASGNYITTILSAGYADKTEVGGATSLIAQKLLDMGYAVDGKAVAISYDKARYCYSSNNTGGSFDAYRFTGQWLQQSEFATAKVYTEVGMLTDNGEELAGSSTAAYGSATVSVDTTKLSHNQQGQYGTGTTDGVNYAYTTIVDGDKQAITLSASASNFAGWYYYDADGEFTQATKETSFTPTYSKDVTYYAMYEARATYAYRYQGRETARSYSVDGGELTEAEITDGNKVAKTRTDFGTKSPGSDTVSIFKKTLTWDNSVTTGMLDNDTAYTMKISNATVTPQSFTVTAHYKSDASGSDATKAKTAAYNTAVDFTVENSDTALTGYYTGHRFIGWYECDSSGNLVTPNVLLSTQANYGMVVTKNLHIKAVYDNDGIANPSDYTWRVFVDDHEITREKYTSTSGTYYNDTIIRVRNNAEGTVTTLPTGAEVGILVIDANGSGLSTTASNAKLETFANGLSSGQTGKIGSTGRTVTKVSTTTLTRFGRADLATRKDFSVADATGYSVYAYYKNAIGEYSFSLVNTGTYTVA